MNGANTFGEPSNVLINKKVFDKIGYFDTSLIQLVDLEMWHRISLKYNIVYVNKILSKFRIHNNQLTILNNKNHKQLIKQEKINICTKLYLKLKKRKFRKFYLLILYDRIAKDKLAMKPYWPYLKPFWRRFIQPLWKLNYGIKKKFYKALRL